MHHDSKAYLFESALPLGQIKEKLNALGPWEWIDRDSDRHGDYLSTFVPPSSRLKLYEEKPGHYQLDVKFTSDAPTAVADADDVHRRVASVFLPGIGAKSVRLGAVED